MQRGNPFGILLKTNSRFIVQNFTSILIIPARYYLTSFKRVADLLSTKGTKSLRLGDFLSCFDDATTLSIPRGKMEAMTSGSDLQQLAGMLDLAEMARLANIAEQLETPCPLLMEVFQINCRLESCQIAP